MDDSSVKLTEVFWPLFERAFEGVLLVEPGSWQIAYANPVAAEWLGHRAPELIGRKVVTFFTDASREDVLGLLSTADAETLNGQQLLAELRSAQGRIKIVSVRCCRVLLERKELIGVLMDGVATTRVDPLTALRDRNYLYSRLGELLERAASDRFAILFVDIDGFKSVNDRHGHLIGDQVLFEVAKRLSTCLREHDVVRYGGDEFVVLIEKPGDAQKLEALADKILSAIVPVISVPNGDVKLSASVGIAMSSPAFRVPDDVIAAADRAMYAAKRGK
jgi:diguanylate cyclase (GGDEF)-like protein/PAS domain S-box-containing protein